MEHPNKESKNAVTTKAVVANEGIPWYLRMASLIGIVAMYVLFGLICSLIGFVAFFLTKSKIGGVKAVVVAVVVAAIAKAVLLSSLK